jgi:two-component system phosphate regulon response regulator PhoB
VKRYALVVEDNREMQAILVDILQLMGLDVKSVGRGDDALVQMLREAPALVLLDVDLPGMLSGIDVLMAIRNDVTLAATKVILLTAQHVAARIPEADKADLIMLKPVDAEQLILLTERLLQSHV